MQVELVLRLVGPGVLGIEDPGINVVQGLGVLQVEDGQRLELSVSQGAVVDSVDDVASGLNTDALREEISTLP